MRTARRTEMSMAARYAMYSRIFYHDVRPQHAVRQRVVRFGAEPHQYAVACLPRHPAAGPWVYFVLGGGWRSGTARGWTFAGRALAARGIPTVVGGHRLAPAHHFPAQLEDVLAGMSAALATPRSLDIDDRPLVLVGASSGGNLAALATIAMARHSARPPIAGLVTVNAALNPTPGNAPGDDALLDGYAGHPGPWPEVNPTVQLLEDPPPRGTMPPCLLVQGDRDMRVPPPVVDRFAAVVETVSPASAEVMHVPWLGHSQLVELFMRPGLPEAGRIVEWIRARG